MSRRDAVKTLALGMVAMASARLMGEDETGFPAGDLITRPVPSSNERLPVIGLGTWQTFDVGSSAAERGPLAEVLNAFVELGGRLVDSSPMYGRSEETVGALAAQLGLQDRLFVATKVWTTGRQAGLDQMDQSCRRLRRDRVDLMQVHNLVDAETHLATLREWKQAGRVRYVGLTHYTTSGQDAVVRLLEHHAVDFVQINYSVAEREAERRVLPLARERGIAVIANRPFAEGGLLRRVRARALPPWAAEIGCTSWAQLLLKFIVSHPAITCAIPATSKVAHVRDNMRAAFGPLADDRLRRRIAEAAA